MTLPQPYSDPDPLEIIRLRPGLWLGGRDRWALHYLLYEVIDNAINQAERELCSKLWVTLRPQNTLVVKDDGPGIPVDPYEDSKRSILELIFTKALGRYNAQTGKFYSTFFGVGLPAVNALSATLEVEVARDGFIWKQNFQAGKVQGPLQQIRPMRSDESTGTIITFTPDFTIFEANDFDHSILSERLQDLAFLASNLTITLRDERSAIAKEDIFHYPQGLLSYVDYLREDHLPAHQYIQAKRRAEIKLDYERRPSYIEIEFVAQYATDDINLEASFANRFKLLDGGPHMYGLREAFKDLFNRFALENELLATGDAQLTDAEILTGLVTVVNITNLHPGQPHESRSELPYPQLREIMYDFVRDTLTTFAQEHPQQMRIMVDWIIEKRFSEAL